MNEKTFEVIAELMGSQMAETERVVNSVIDSLQERIDSLEEENAYLRDKLNRLSMTSLLDLAVA